MNHGIDVSVISFATQAHYVLDGVKVYTLNSYKNELIDEKFDLLVSHVPNIRNHYRFLKECGKYFSGYTNQINFLSI